MADHRGGRLGHGAAPELGELLVRNAVEVLALCELFRRREWLLLPLELGIERADRGPRVDVDHPGDQLRDAISCGVTGSTRAAMDSEDDRPASVADGGNDRFDVVVKADVRAIRVC